MPVFGSGILPPAGAVAAELSAVTRRAFIPRVFVQLYQASPMLAALIQSAQSASGGVSPITAPLQGNPMVTCQPTGYDGSFNQPAVTPGLQNAEYDLAAYTTAIPFLGFEGLVQLDYDVVPLIDARMNDASNVTIQKLGTDLYNNVSNNLEIIGLPAAVDDGTFAATYGGIARLTTNSLGQAWWKSTYVHNASPVTPTRELMMQYILQVTKKNGEMPKMGIMGLGTWGLLVQDFIAQERYLVNPDGAYGDNLVKSAFQALMIGGVPFYADPFCPEGTLYLLNTDYMSLYIHEKGAFNFTGFESTVPNGQLGYIGLLVTVLQLTNVKAQAQGKFDGLASLSI